MPLAMVLDESITKLCVSGDVLDVPVGLKKCLDSIGVSCWFNMTPNIVIEKLQVHIPLILDDHIMKNHTCRHYLIEGFVPKIEPGLEQWQINLACKTLKALSISFQHASWAFAN
jgi:hypothetical protein